MRCFNLSQGHTPCYFLTDVTLSDHVTLKMGPVETQANETSHMRELRVPRGGGGGAQGVLEQADQEAPLCTCSPSISEPTPPPPGPSQTGL